MRRSACTRRTRCATTWSRSCRRRGTRPTSSRPTSRVSSTTARARARASRSCTRRAPSRCIAGRSYVIPEDVKALAHRVLRHRVVLTFEADALEIRSEQVIDAIIAAIPAPVGSPPAMVALLPRVKSRLFIHANRRSTNLLEGEYAAITAGRSLDFDDLREYVAGDEVDDIDWKATARTGSPLVKRYKQTRRQDVILAVDTGRGMAAAAEGGGAKRDVAVLIAGALGYLSLRHGDAVGTRDACRRARAASPAAGERGVPRDPPPHRRPGDAPRRRPERPVRARQLPAARRAQPQHRRRGRRRRRARPRHRRGPPRRCARSTSCSGSRWPTST